MIVRLYKSYMNGVALEQLTDINLDSSVISTDTGDDFVLRYQDVEPKLVLQFIVTSSDSTEVPISFAQVSSEDVQLSCSMCFTSTLIGQINSLSTQIISSYDPRFTNKSILSIDQEKVLVLSVSHNYPINQTYLTVQRSSSPATHYADTLIRVVRTNPSISLLDRSQGTVQINWLPADTDSPGLYYLEVTVTRGSGDSYLKWSLSPIRMRVDEDYNLS